MDNDKHIYDFEKYLLRYSNWLDELFPKEGNSIMETIMVMLFALPISMLFIPIIPLSILTWFDGVIMGWTDYTMEKIDNSDDTPTALVIPIVIITVLIFLTYGLPCLLYALYESVMDNRRRKEMKTLMASIDDNSIVGLNEWGDVDKVQITKTNIKPHKFI